MPAESTLHLLSTVSLFFAQQAAAKFETLLGGLVQQRETTRDIPSRVGSAAAGAKATAAPGMGGSGAVGTAGRAAGAAAATFATGWAVANNKVPPATGIIPYAILEAAAELKVKTERCVFEGSNVALGVLLLPFHVLSCGLRALGWARVMVCIRLLAAHHAQCVLSLPSGNVTRIAGYLRAMCGRSRRAQHRWVA
eukprot:COSAG02_NODE_1065_length_14831_cov_34.330981_3_plen_195_part_00